jgi:hypothetical protein
MRVWAGDGGTLRVLPISLPTLFAVMYIAGLILLFAGGVFVARGLGASWLAVAAAMALLTLRHRFAKTGANSLEGYMHPRMIAFAFGLIAFGFLLRRRWIGAIASVFVAASCINGRLWFGAHRSWLVRGERSPGLHHAVSTFSGHPVGLVLVAVALFPVTDDGPVVAVDPGRKGLPVSA